MRSRRLTRPPCWPLSVSASMVKKTWFLSRSMSLMKCSSAEPHLGQAVNGRRGRVLCAGKAHIVFAGEGAQFSSHGRVIVCNALFVEFDCVAASLINLLREPLKAGHL